jgi:hypothetical protein
MPQRGIHQCQGPACTDPAPHPERKIICRIKLLMSRFDEHQRCGCAVVESANIRTAAIAGDR